MSEITGVPPRALANWQQQGLVVPGLEADGEFFYSFIDLVCLKALDVLESKTVDRARAPKLMESLRNRLLDLGDSLGHRSVAVSIDRIVVARKHHFVDARADKAIARFDLDDLIRDVSELCQPEEAAKSAEEWFQEGLTLAANPETGQPALQAFREVLKLDPSRGDAYIEMGKIHYRERQLVDAERSLRSARLRAPYNPQAHYLLGRVMEDLGCPEEALACYEKSLEANPGFKNAHYRIGRLCVRENLLDRALRHWNRYLTLDPNSPRSEAVRRQIHRLSVVMSH